MVIFKEGEMVWWLGCWHEVALRRCRTQSSSGCSGLSIPIRDSSTEFSQGQHWCGDGASAFTGSCCHTMCTHRKRFSPHLPHILLAPTLSPNLTPSLHVFLLHTFISESLRCSVAQEHIWTFFLHHCHFYSPEPHISCLVPSGFGDTCTGWLLPSCSTNRL